MSEENKAKDWYDIANWCGKPISVLDIGCGSGLIHKRLVPSLRPIEVHLMDGNSKCRSQMGWNPEGTKPWENVNHAVGKVKMLGMCKAIGYMANPRLTIPADLIISLKSWGFHYPIHTYMNLAKRSLRPGGTIIVDLRKGANQIEEMAQSFHLVELNVGRSRKCFRSVWEHKA